MPRTNDIFIDINQLKQGLVALEDETKAPAGSAKTMRNMRITDRGGVAPRLGTLLLGTKNVSNSPVRGLYNFRKSFDADEFLLKAYDDELEVYSKNHSSADWFRLKNQYTADKEFGFTTSLVNTDNEDYIAFCNRFDPYQRWRGSVTLLNGALVGAETAVTVDSVLTEEVFFALPYNWNGSLVATADIAGGGVTINNLPANLWADDQWNGFYVHILTGSHTGKIRLITDSAAAGSLTVDTFGGNEAGITFEIRKAAFPATGTLIYNGTRIAYTAIPTATTFTVASAHASADNAAVALVPDDYYAAPRGNRITNYLSRIIVGNVRSAMARGSGGALQGFASAGSAFVSKLLNPFDFSFTATRVAGEGDIISMPYGGGDITDVVYQEDTAYVLKPRYIEAIQYSQDSNDLANRTPLKAGIGSVGPTIKGPDDIYFITADNQFTSIGRVQTKDIKPETLNIGHKVKRLLESRTFGTGRGFADQARIYVPGRSTSDEASNDVVLVYNQQNRAFEGDWQLRANFFESFNGKAYFGESNSSNVYQMNIGNADVVGADRFGIDCEYESNFMNLTGSHAYSQAMSSLYFEGYITANEQINFFAKKDFAMDPFLSFSFLGSEESLQDGSVIEGYLGGTPLGLRPIGSFSEPLDENGRRHFQFRVYFPFQYGNHFSVGWGASEVDADFEITRYGLGMLESVSVDTNRVKVV